MVATPGPAARSEQPPSAAEAPEAPAPPPAPPRSSLTRALGELAEPAQFVTSLFVLVGAGLYATIRFGHQIFYSRFDVRPEEVGQTYAASVSRAAVTIVTVGSAVAFWVAGVQLWATIRERSRAERGLDPKAGNPGPDTFVSAVLVVGPIVVLGLLGGTIVWLLFVPAALVLLLLLWQGVKHVGKLLGRDLSLAPGIVTESFREPVGIVAGLAFLLVVLLALSGISAIRAANSVKAGRAVGPASGFGILGLRAEPVLVIGDLPENLELSNRGIMYLGQADGTVVLYDVHAEETIRAPADGIAVFPGWVHEEDVSLHPDEEVDLDLREDQRGGVRPAGEMNEGDVELYWRKEKLLVGTQLDPTSLVRAGMAGDLLTSSRNACLQIDESIDELDIEALYRGLRFCVRTDENHLVLLTVIGIETSPRSVTLEKVVWPA